MCLLFARLGKEIPLSNHTPLASDGCFTTSRTINLRGAGWMDLRTTLVRDTTGSPHSLFRRKSTPTAAVYLLLNLPCPLIGVEGFDTSD